jgi:hypothetical protein
MQTLIGKRFGTSTLAMASLVASLALGLVLTAGSAQG